MRATTGKHRGRAPSSRSACDSATTRPAAVIFVLAGPMCQISSGSSFCSFISYFGKQLMKMIDFKRFSRRRGADHHGDQHAAGRGARGGVQGRQEGALVRLAAGAGMIGPALHADAHARPSVHSGSGHHLPWFRPHRTHRRTMAISHLSRYLS